MLTVGNHFLKPTEWEFFFIATWLFCYSLNLFYYMSFSSLKPNWDLEVQWISSKYCISKLLRSVCTSASLLITLIWFQKIFQFYGTDGISVDMSGKMQTSAPTPLPNAKKSQSCIPTPSSMLPAAHIVPSFFIKVGQAYSEVKDLTVNRTLVSFSLTNTGKDLRD